MTSIYDFNKYPIINSFKLFDQNYQETFDYIKKYNLESELDQILKNNNKIYESLLKFSFEYGILSITRFIYEQINYPFEIHIITEYVSTSNQNQNKNTENANNMVSVSGNNNDSDSGSLRFAIEDKYSKTRNECISYILNMKKYSSYVSKNKKFYYRFNKEKYKHLFV